MLPPHESDSAQLPQSLAGGDQSGDAPDAPGTRYDFASRWHVIGRLPAAGVTPTDFTAGNWAGGTAASAPDSIASFAAIPTVCGTAPLPAIPVAPAPHSQMPAAGIGLTIPVKIAAPVDIAAAPPAVPAEMSARRSGLREVPSWLVSVVVHLAVLIALASLQQWWHVDETRLATALRFDDRSLDSLVDADEPQLEEVDLTSLESAETQLVEAADTGDVLDKMGFDDDPLAAQLDAFAPPDEPATMVAATSDQLFKTATGGDLSGRGALSKGDLLILGGGTPASEEAVALALRWIVAHQAEDGGWNFDHSQGAKCGKRCSTPGSARNARNGATAMALLPLLGAGNTHQSGKYRESVDRGLQFLMTRQDKKTGSFHEPQGDMYSHGLAAIALCEAYAMTKDRKLHEPSQGAIDFITTAQDPVGGGWRYAPRQPGDTSVVGWQMMALKSGLMGYLDVPPDTVRLAGRFLDHVQDGDGSQYGYTNSGGEPATTSIGLLCRMYLGWRRDHPPLVRGIEYLRKTGPSPSNMYYNYYATQVVHHYGGDAWRDWNAKMRDSLVKDQIKTGHSAGSWVMGDRFVGQGGRLYCTSLAAMILEVYYRHLPIYREESVRPRPAAQVSVEEALR